MFFAPLTVEQSADASLFGPLSPQLPIIRPPSPSCAGQGYGISWPANTICKHDRLDEEDKQIDNFYK